MEGRDDDFKGISEVNGNFGNTYIAIIGRITEKIDTKRKFGITYPFLHTVGHTVLPPLLNVVQWFLSFL